MIIKKYVGANAKEALKKVERDLGKEAVIISQRAIRKPGFMGFFSPKIVEITATVETLEKNKSFIPNSNVSDVYKKEEINYEEDKEIRKEVEEMKSILNAYIKVKNDELKQEQEKKIDEKVDNSVIDNDIKFLKYIEEKLSDMDVPKSIIKDIKKDLEDKKVELLSEKDADKFIRQSIENYITVDEGEISGVVALVGPTGVGKTTTIAKLAGNLALIKRKKVGLITVDTYRIGAVEQLRTYAEIMNIKFKVVFSIGEMEEAIEAMKDCDVILIDTTGRSSKNTMQVMELKAYIDKANVNSSYLVVSATTKEKDIDIISEGFSTLDYRGVILTKLDETSTYGALINLCKRTKVPIKYITFGQSVPEDIRVPSREEIIDIVLGEKDVC
ncbi:MAG: flagellar biosynthesis protein FlhF [Clostridium sp.]|nr:flagellar biosynthesis protein FlhF [Clostridium sp.]